MDLNDIKALIEAMQASDLAEMEFSENGWTLRLVRSTGHATPPANPGSGRPVKLPSFAEVPLEISPVVPSGDVRAPLSGIVHLQPAQAGATVCIIEAMKVFNSVRAERDGTVEAVLVAPGDDVEAGQTLMRIV